MKTKLLVSFAEFVGYMPFYHNCVDKLNPIKNWEARNALEKLEMSLENGKNQVQGLK